MTPLPEINWSGAFADAATESDFRAHRMATDQTLMRMVCVIIIFGVFGYVLSDIRNPNMGSTSWRVLIAARAVVVVAAFFYATAIRRVRDIRVLDTFTMIIVLAVTFSSIWANSVRPKDFFVHIGPDVGILIGIYFVIPLSQRLRIGVAATYSAALAYLYFFYKDAPDALTQTSVLTSLITANLLGLLISFRHARDQRSEYTALKNEQASKHDLDRAQSEIRSLSGLIPICAGCKNVRNDQGYWEQVESYIRARSEAEFSHSLCPECQQKYSD